MWLAALWESESLGNSRVRSVHEKIRESMLSKKRWLARLSANCVTRSWWQVSGEMRHNSSDYLTMAAYAEFKWTAESWPDADTRLCAALKKYSKSSCEHKSDGNSVIFRMTLRIRTYGSQDSIQHTLLWIELPFFHLLFQIIAAIPTQSLELAPLLMLANTFAFPSTHLQWDVEFPVQ